MQVVVGLFNIQKIPPQLVYKGKLSWYAGK
jgi:hypothetical protein